MAAHSMATISKNLAYSQEQPDATIQTHPHPHWYSPRTGIYHSKHPPLHLPTDPFLDVVSLISSQNRASNSALVDSITGASIPYSELFSLIKSMASGLHHQMGVSQGDVVLMFLPNSIYFPVVFLAVLSLGAVVTTMNPLSTQLEVEKQARDCNVSFAFATPDNVDKLSSFGFPVVDVPSNFASSKKTTDNSVFGKLIASDPNLAPTPSVRQQDVAAILHSSGTTGNSKGVVLTHRNLIASVMLFVRFEASQYDDSSEENVYLAVLPMFHIYGLSLFVLGLISLGSTVVVMSKFDADEMVRVIDRYEVTHFPVVPPLLMPLAKRAKGSVIGCSLRSLKQVSCGAAPVSTRIMEDVLQCLPHVDFIQGYGMTETTAVGTRGYNTGKHKNYTSAGLLAPNMEAKVVDWITDTCLPPGCMGELWLRGPGIMQGYLNDVKATNSIINADGWLHTGDIVFFDQEGYLYIVDRLKEMIKYRGFQVAPADLEAVLVSHPEITDAAVTAERDEEAGEIPVAFVVKTEGSTLSRADIIDFVSKKVAPFKKVRKVYFRGSIPRSAAGKILRRELRNFLSKI